MMHSNQYKDWKHRKPPEGVVEEHQLMLCIMPQPCIFGDQCQSAHSVNELTEWKARLRLESNHLCYSKDASMNVEDHRISIQNKLNELDDDEQKSVLTELIGDHSVLCDENLFIMHVDKDKELAWMFTITRNIMTSNHKLERVFFMNECAEFTMEYVFYTEMDYVKLPTNCKMWENEKKDENIQVLRILIRFSSRKYGNFCQEVVFDFGGYPKVVRKIGVQVANEETLAQTMKYNPVKFENNELSWIKKHKIISLDGTEKPGIDSITYQLPPNIENLVVFDAFKHLDLKLTKQNYRTRLHTLLFLEEYQRRANLQSITFHLDELAICLDKPKKKKSVDLTTASVVFDEYIIADLTRLVGRSGKALIRLNQYEQHGTAINDVVIYEVVVQSIEGNTLVFDLTENLASLVRSSAIPVDVDVCFCLIDTFQTLHNAVDNVNLDLIFPNIKPIKSFPYSEDTDLFLSKEQSRAVSVILDKTQTMPVLLLGPFGAGKTRTLAQAVKELITHKEDNNRVLICTHSNSAADHYIEEYFHPLHKQTNNLDTSLTPLRINWEHRYTSTVSDKVLAYCLQDKTTGLFVAPTRDELDKHSLVISTLVTSEILSKLDLPLNYFTHVVIDEAAQAMEVEAIVPMLLAWKETKIVFAGDHMQMSEPLSSPVAKDLGLGKSLLERLFELYPFDADCKLKLLENFRSYKEIVDLSSHLFYEDSLHSNKIKPDDARYPVEFYGVTGIEVLSKDNPSYENIAEATEVLLRITDILDFWDEKGVEFDLRSICVLSFYPAQVRRIRKVLRRNDMGTVRVESVNNIQGLEFDTVIISTVRTQCDITVHDDQMMKDMGFLTNPKLLNTAITRARYQVILVGDPRALCTVGECKACWKTIIRTCDENDTFKFTESYEKLLQHKFSQDILPTTNTCQEEVDNEKSVHTDVPSSSSVNSLPMNFQPDFQFVHQGMPGYHFGEFNRMRFSNFCRPQFIPFAMLPTHMDPRGFLNPCQRTAFMDPRGAFMDPRGAFMSPRGFLNPCQRPAYIRMQRPPMFYPPQIQGESFHAYPYHNQPRFLMSNISADHFYDDVPNQSRILPLSKSFSTLRQKMQYVDEYSGYLMDNVGEKAKSIVTANMRDAFRQLNALSSESYRSSSVERIETLTEDTYLYAENEYMKHMNATQIYDSSSKKVLRQKYGMFRRQVSELNIYLEHEIYKDEVLHEDHYNADIREQLRSLSYFVDLVHHEIDVCGDLLKSPTFNLLVPTKLEFLEQQLDIGEANRQQIEEKLNVKSVEIYQQKEDVNKTVVNKKTSETVESGTSSEISIPVPLSPVIDCELGAVENKLAAMTVEDEDPDLVLWFAERRNDPYVQEYVTSHSRQNADRLPSPTDDVNPTAISSLEPQSCDCKFKFKKGKTKRCKWFGTHEEESSDTIKRNVSDTMHSTSHHCKLKSKLRKDNSKHRCSEGEETRDGVTDYSMNPPYPSHELASEMRNSPDVFEGVIRYLPVSSPNKIHGTVFLKNSMQIHINGLKRNNRALPGDTVLLKIKRNSQSFDIPGVVLKVVERSSRTYSCGMICNDLVCPVKEYGPPILLVRGIGTYKQELCQTKLYDVKIIEWPENMMYPLGEIVNIFDR